MKTLLIGINSKYIHPSMGIFQIKTNSKSEVIIKEFTIKDDFQNIINYIKQQSFDLLGFSVYIWNSLYVQNLLNHLDNKIPILLGGPEASYNYQEFFHNKNVNYIIKNEGEESFNELIEYLSKKRPLNLVSNLFYYDNGIHYTFDKLPNIKNIKHDFSLIKDFDHRIVYLESSRGCPFHCSYCLASLEKKVRYFNIEQVKKEIEFAYSKHSKTVKFLDRSFNIDQLYMLEILKFIKENDNGITTFQFEIVGDLIKPETIEFLKTLRRGLLRFEIGIQSTNQVVTDAVNRVQNFEKLKENVIAIKESIIVHADLIAGLPFEDKTSFINTFNQTFELYPDELQLGFLKELKGTYISETKDYHDYQFNSQPPYEIIQNKYISKDELDEIRDVEESLNKYYNSNHFPRTIHYLFKELKFNPYFTFLKITRFIKKDHQFYKLQPYEVTSLLYQALKDDVSEELLYIIKQDYLLKDEQKPKIWWDSSITKEERNQVFNCFINKYHNLKIDHLYHYGRLEKYQTKYFVVTYQPKNIYFIDTLKD